MEFKRVYERFINCDFCGQSTRGRIWDCEPDVVRCGSCRFPMSEGRFVNLAQGEKEAGGWQACPKN